MDAVSTAPWWLQASVAAAVFAYLPSYWSFKELAPGGDCRRGFQCWAGWRAVASFLFGEAKLVVEAPEKLKACPQGILAVAPHGVVSFNHALYMTDCAGWFGDGVPLYREFLLFLGNVDASRRVARRVLGSGRSLFVYPGGEAEQMRAAPGRHIAYWKTRKGFVRLAVEAGVPIIPSYAFGENELYAPLPLATGLRLWICRKFRVALPLGKFDETVDEVHAKVCAAVVALFDRHKAQHAHKDATLEII
ncbi:2-acylglycerol O-acyltransferase [Aureococcus anophagefferens]|nr:2-acylglycerol O-acyltransferase [Aureococcus anophagefferens]